jgi:hypothetical protein
MDQNLADQVGGDPEKLRAGATLHSTLIHKSQISFVDESGWLQGVVTPLALQIARGQTPKFAINERQQSVQGGPVAIAPRQEQARNLAWFRLRHHPSLSQDYTLALKAIPAAKEIYKNVSPKMILFSPNSPM